MDSCAAARQGLEQEPAAQLLQSLAHVVKTIAMRPHRCLVGHAATVVLDTHAIAPPRSAASCGGFLSQSDANYHFRSLGVFACVVQRFLGGEKKIVSHLGWDRHIRQACGYIEPAANRCTGEEISRELANVTGQPV